VDPHSYEVQVGGACYSCNWRRLILKNEDLLEEHAIPDQQTSPGNELPNSSDNHSDTETVIPEEHIQSSGPETAHPESSPTPRRLGRVTRKPRWMEDYVPSS